MSGTSGTRIGLKSTDAPYGKEKRTEVVETIGADGYALLDAIFTKSEWNWLRHLGAVEILRRVWVHQFELVDGQVRYRSDDSIPPPAKMICSPYDVEATYGRKLTTWWVGDIRPPHRKV